MKPAAIAAQEIKRWLKYAGIEARVRACRITVNVELKDASPIQMKLAQKIARELQIASGNAYGELYEFNNRRADLPAQVNCVNVSSK